MAATDVAQKLAPRKAECLAVDPFAQEGFDLRFDWGAAGLARLAPQAGVVVLVDVLSFTTAVDVAVSRGAAVVPAPWAGPATASPGELVAVGRSQMDAEHPWSLSPASLITLPAGNRLVLPSPNGGALARSAGTSGATHVLAGCLRNASAVAAAAGEAGGVITLIAAGERQGPDAELRPALEDLLGAGAVLAALAGAGRSASPEAVAAVAALASMRHGLAEVLWECASGRELRAGGFRADVEMAAALDVSTIVPRLDEGAFSAGTVRP